MVGAEGGEDIRTKEEEYGWRAIQTDAGQRTDGWEGRDNIDILYRRGITDRRIVGQE
jgi:hypothetical protein